MEIRNYDENTQIEPIENDRVYIHRQSLKLLDEYIEIGSVYEFRRLKKESDEYFLKWLEYKKLEEQGLLLRLPCKVGDTVYTTCAWGIESGVVGSIEIISDRIFVNNIHGAMIGEAHNIYLTKEEAEQALAEMERKNG